MKVRDYLAAVFDGMAKGLFASLIIGTILAQIGQSAGWGWLVTVGTCAKMMMGPAIGAGVALRRGVKPYTLLAAIAAGALGAGTFAFADGAAVAKIGDPMGALAAVWVAVELGRLVEGRTKFDLLLAPATVVLSGAAVGHFVSPLVARLMAEIGVMVNTFTELQPFFMGILVALTVGVVLTLPMTSSAALCIAIGIDGLAAGAACAGGAAQMVGFAAISFRENRWGGVIAQGAGTAMIQFPNIIKNPWVWLPPLVASAICGPLATLAFHLRTNSVGAGMGTSGLVGPITTVTEMGATAETFLAVTALLVVIPAAISLVLAEFMRKSGLIKPGDLKL